MDLEEWEVVPEDGFLQIHDDGAGKKIFSRKYGAAPTSHVFKMNYFVCPPPENPANQFFETTTQLLPLPLPSVMIWRRWRLSRIGCRRFSSRKLRELDFPKSNNSAGEVYKADQAMDGKNFLSSPRSAVEDDDGDSSDHENGGLNLLNWSMTGVGAILSFGVAAVVSTVCILIAGNRKNHRQNHKLRLQIYTDDKRIKQMVHHATRLNQANGAPSTRAHITIGGKMILEGSLSFKGSEMETKISLVSPLFHKENKEMVISDGISCEKLPTPDSTKVLPPNTSNQRNLAALKLQKTYKSFCTRRQLADCAVLVGQRWWKLLDSVELKHNSVSFFDIEKPETAASRWSRASAKAAKVGKGLSKDEKARKLALQHWLEAIDPRHSYGHNLQFYYAKWLQRESRQPFFYWLDIGEGKEVNLERCSRCKLQQQCIKYLGPVVRQTYEVIVVEGKFMYKQSGKLLDTDI